MAKKAENLKQPPKPSLDIAGVSGSVLVENSNYSIGEYFNEQQIREIHKLELSINHLGVITWKLYDSNYNHRVKWMNGEIREVKNYYLCVTCYYPNIKFAEWGKYTHKTNTYRVAESLGFESPRKMADYLISTYKNGFKGQLISFAVMGF